MPTVVYLDVEDEITTAAARIRAANAPRVGIVIPFGSRVATSRINFRLLAREAQDAKRRLDIVAPDASTRALAASAGLPVFASVGEYEAALESGEAALSAAAAAEAVRGEAATHQPERRDPDAATTAAPAATAVLADRRGGQDAARGSRQPQARPAHARPATEAEIAAPGRSAGAQGARETAPEPASGHRGRRLGVLVLALALVLVLAFGGAAAALALPSAEITVTPRLEPVPPVSLTVRADTNATAVDPATHVIPAKAVQVPVTAQGAFAVTGVSIQQTTATGQVTFDSINTVNAMPVPRGTRVSTGDGITFLTTSSVTVPRATVPGGGSTITHGTATVGVAAAAPGPKGNVAAGAIDQVPSSLAALQISVSNAAATTGGTKTELPKIAPADVTAATDKLKADLQAQLTTALADPSIVPDGTKLFPDTAVLGAPTFTPDPAGLAGRVLKAGESTFSLQASATANVTAIDESPLQGMAEDALRAAVTPGDQLVASSVQITVGSGTVGEDGVVSYPVTASALQRRPVDAAALKKAVLGKSPAEASAALASVGTASVTLWPFWVTAVPTNPDRVTVRVGEPVAPPATPGASPSAAPSPTARPTEPGGTASPSGAGSPSGPAPSTDVQTTPSPSPVPSA